MRSPTTVRSPHTTPVSGVLDREFHFFVPIATIRARHPAPRTAFYLASIRRIVLRRPPCLDTYDRDLVQFWYRYWPCQPNAAPTASERRSPTNDYFPKTCNAVSTSRQCHRNRVAPDSKSGSSATELIGYPGAPRVKSPGIPEGHKGWSGPGIGRVRPHHAIAAPRQRAAVDPAQAGEDLLMPGSGGLDGSCGESSSSMPRRSFQASPTPGSRSRMKSPDR